MTTIKAQNLTAFTFLADGALITRVSVQRDWVYAQIVKDGWARTRRYRHNQGVKVK